MINIHADSSFLAVRVVGNWRSANYTLIYHFYIEKDFLPSSSTVEHGAVNSGVVGAEPTWAAIYKQDMTMSANLMEGMFVNDVVYD